VAFTAAGATAAESDAQVARVSRTGIAAALAAGAATDTGQQQVVL
jgi:hypothetical protein